MHRLPPPAFAPPILSRLVFLLSVLAAIVTCQAAVETAVEFEAGRDGTTRVHNANHIFNAIHSSLRQWGSAVNHNGMTAFLATVPQGSLLYRGTRGNRTIRGAAWVAFEPEHALWHAAGKQARKRAVEGHIAPLDIPLAQSPLSDGSPPPPPPVEPDASTKPRHGWLWTHRAKRDLRLVYFDGLSAAKSSKGTLDLQDAVVLDYEDPAEAALGTFDDTRARGLCDVVRDRWQGSVDGFIRARLGFEVLLCSIEPMEVHSVTLGTSASYDTESYFQYWSASAKAKYDGSRILLHRASFFTMFDTHESLFDTDQRHPRLINIPHERLAAYRANLDDFVVQHDWTAVPEFDWQALTDALVARYGGVVQILQGSELTSSLWVRRQVEPILRPFVDHASPDRAGETRRCMEHSLQGAPTHDHTFAAVATVAERVCFDLVSLRHEHDVSAAKRTVAGLAEYLAWTSWQQCSGCTPNEVCFVPISPWGTVLDAERPSCVNSTTIRGRSGYWAEKAVLGKKR